MGEDHVAEDLLERYSMRVAFEMEAARVEEHLLLCAACRRRLVRIEEFLADVHAAFADLDNPIDFTHQTAHGPIRLLVRPGSDCWVGFLGDNPMPQEFGALSEANASVRAAFSRLFPGHRCGPRCGDTCRSISASAGFAPPEL